LHYPIFKHREADTDAWQSADEPRRSGRATKGQHTKNNDEELPAAQKQGVKGKTGKKKGKDEPEEEEDDSIIRCVCGATADEDGWPMICCDKCEAWQHNLCMGVSEDDDELPEKYYCEQCRPSDHRPLLAAIKRGEKPWEARITQRRREEEEAEKKKKGKGKRKSAGGTATPKETPAKTTPVPDGGNKRKFEEPQAEVSTVSRKKKHYAVANTVVKPTIKKSASPVVTATPSLGHRKSSAQAIAPDAKRRKSTVDIAHTRRSSSAVLPLATSLEELATNRQPAAKAISSKAKGVIDQLVKDGSYRIPDGETAASLATSLSLRIENALMSLYGDPAGYKTQFMMIISNIPKNTQLILQLFTDNLTPIEIAEMSSDDMASEDVQKERARAKEEADKQSILITEQGPRMRKTHKGDEIIGEETSSRPVDDASWVNQPIRRRDTQDEVMADAGASPQEEPGSPHRVELPEDAVLPPHPPPLNIDTKPSPQQRKPSTFDMDRAWGAAHSPNQSSYGAVQTPRTQHAPTHSPVTQMHDADIDRLLKDEDEEDVPMSPVVDGTSGGAVWKGRIDMAGVAGFSASARWVAGGDVGQKIAYKDLLPRKMEITGRIAIPRADEYVSGMRYSQSNDVCCLAITPFSGGADRESFAKIFEYFHSKARWGVINGTGLHEAVRDCYLVTLEAGAGGWPDFMGMLEERQIEEPRPDNMLILTMVVKTKSPQSTPAPAQAAAPATAGAQPQPSPVIPQGNGTSSSLPLQQPVPPVSYPWATETVKAILGPEIHAPAVVQLFTAVPEMTEVQVKNLREALEREPAAREDLGKLGEVLRAGQGA
jgi:hypothetical protein